MHTSSLSNIYKWWSHYWLCLFAYVQKHPQWMVGCQVVQALKVGPHLPLPNIGHHMAMQGLLQVNANLIYKFYLWTSFIMYQLSVLKLVSNFIYACAKCQALFAK